MRQMNWHRQFSTEDRLIEVIEDEKGYVSEGVFVPRETKQISGSVKLGDILKAKLKSTPSAQ